MEVGELWLGVLGEAVPSKLGLGVPGTGMPVGTESGFNKVGVGAGTGVPVGALGNDTGIEVGEPKVGVLGAAVPSRLGLGVRFPSGIEVPIVGEATGDAVGTSVGGMLQLLLQNLKHAFLALILLTPFFLQRLSGFFPTHLQFLPF